ncbi:MAG: RagB/SusD family nutrient uptake outer membrane protein [Tannerella sp.]|jgi:hypothetical protein|nr:RagB/SusD family nutrient uptake outer membrane protein [Tannerella sp.]
MKSKIFNISMAVLLIMSLAGCEDAVDLNRYPLDMISSEDYWKTTSDLELYVNQFYSGTFWAGEGDQLQGNYSRDIQSDDMTYVEANARLRGSMSVPSTGGWDYSKIRSINYFFANYERCGDSFDSYKAILGAAHFFRAFYYFGLVREYGDVPYLDKPLDTNSEELYMARTPRNQVVDAIIADLDKAISYLPEGKQLGGTKLSRDVAILFKSRICLYEGTWEKYQTGVFGVSNPNPSKYLTLAVEAAEALMQTGSYGIYNPSVPQWNYFFFGEIDHSNNPEVLFWKKYDLNLGIGHANQFQMATGKGGGIGLTKSFAESYLCTDGQPISLSPLYKGDGDLKTVTTNRDPRMIQTLFTPGFPLQVIDGDTLRFTRPAVDQAAHTVCPTGYQLNKTLNWDPIHHKSLDTHADGYTGWIIFRYAEVLLNYAEAKAELGTLTQQDIDKTIKLLRDRVGMPNLVISDIKTDPNWLFPDLSPIINEIRRERRIEFVAESFRWDDIARWAAADELIVGKRPLGGKFNSIDYPDLSAADYKLTDGYFDPLKEQLPDGFGFKLDRDYLSPIATQELTLNPNLKQNPGW